MYFLKNCFLIVSVLLSNFLAAQNYQAINGSMYAGSLSAGNNPAAIVHVPFKWDITLFAVQAKHSTNIFKINDLSLLSFSPSSATVSNVNGQQKRFLFANQDIRLLNARVSLNGKSAIAFGANIRNYIHATVSESNWQDSAFSITDFLNANAGNTPLAGGAAGTAWAELYGSYARTLVDDGYKLINAGITLKVNRSLAGGYARAEGLRYVPAADPNNGIKYLLTGGNLQYGYSTNFDFIDSTQSFGSNSKTFLKRTYSTVSADIGAEFILLSDTDEDEDNNDEYSYKTKVGIAIMDIGSNRYHYSGRSRLAVAGKEGITDTLLENKFSSVTNVDDFNDSLASVVNSIKTISGDFFIYQPTRLIINVDQRLADDFYLNAELTLPIISLAAKNSLYVKDMNLLALTPRWETKRWGAYMPVLLNVRKQVWIGGAVKAGPVLLGTHNFANVFSKKAMQSGGFYLALTIRPGKSRDRLTGESNTLTKKQRRNLECPGF